jgi:hypothetical protein
MYILRGRALEVERGDSPDLSWIYAPGTWRQARRRLVVVWVCGVAWIPGLAIGGLIAVVALVATFLGLILGLSTQFEAAWIGSPVRPWTLYAIPVALAGFAVTYIVL